jgi:hypothetical protein
MLRFAATASSWAEARRRCKQAADFNQQLQKLPGHSIAPFPVFDDPPGYLQLKRIGGPNAVAWIGVFTGRGTCGIAFRSVPERNGF